LTIIEKCKDSDRPCERIIRLNQPARRVVALAGDVALGVLRGDLLGRVVGGERGSRYGIGRADLPAQRVIAAGGDGAEGVGRARDVALGVVAGRLVAGRGRDALDAADLGVVHHVRALHRHVPAPVRGRGELLDDSPVRRARHRHDVEVRQDRRPVECRRSDRSYVQRVIRMSQFGKSSRNIETLAALTGVSTKSRVLKA